MVAVIRHICFLIAALSFSCAGPTVDEFGQQRVSEREIEEITPVIHKQTYHTSETITAFRRDRSGEIQVWTDSGTIYVVRRVDHTWKIVDTTGIER